MRNVTLTTVAALAAACFAAGSGAQTAPASASAATPPPTTTAPQPRATVSRAQFTSAVHDREPVDELTTLDNSHDKIFFFTELKNAAGQTIVHRWEYNGNTVAEVKFEPKANHWRVWSSKTLIPAMTGTWTVQVLDGEGHVLAKKSFAYTKAAATPAPSAGTGGGMGH